MVALTGKTRSATYKDLLQVSNANVGIDATLRDVEDGEGTASQLQLSTTAVNIKSGFQLNGTVAQTSALLKHEVGGLEADISAVADGDFIVGTGAGTLGLESGATARTSLGVGTGDTVEFNLLGVGNARTEGTLHVHTASAGAVTADAGSDDLVIENSTDAGITILGGTSSASTISFGDSGNATIGHISYDHTNDEMIFRVNAANSFRIGSNGALFIGDTANAKMTVGLTINQGANDNEILALKSSDVGHAMTAEAEADTFGTFSKMGGQGTSGGLMINGYKDADGSAGFALYLSGRLGEAVDTSDITTSNACVHISASVTDGGTGLADVAAAGNILVVENLNTVRLLVKGDGTLHATNITAGSGDLDGVALDHEDDIGLIRMHERTIHKDLGIAMSKWDEQIKVNEDDLKRLGVLSSQGHFYNMQRMNSLLGGAIWQGHVARSELEQAIAETMPAIAARLNEIRAERRLTSSMN